MECGCIKGYYDFYLSSTTNKALLYTDLSVWMTEGGYVVPETYDLTVTTPTKDEFTIAVSTSGVTKISPGPDDTACFADGIYCFSVDNCGTIYKRNKAYIPTLECCLADLISKAKTRKDFDIASELHFYVKSIYVNSELNKPLKAKEFFDLTEQKMKQLNCSCFNK